MVAICLRAARELYARRRYGCLRCEINEKKAQLPAVPAYECPTECPVLTYGVWGYQRCVGAILALYFCPSALEDDDYRYLASLFVPGQKRPWAGSVRSSRVPAGGTYRYTADGKYYAPPVGTMDETR
eukprot:1307742-Rhodomonas_salina.2